MPTRFIRCVSVFLTVLFFAGSLCACELLSPVSETAQPPAPTAEQTPQVQAQTIAPALMISEIMADNETFFLQGFADWVEVFNPSDTAVALDDYYLSGDAFHPYECRLPEGTLAPGAFCVLLCGKDLSFNLAKEGGTLVLTTADGALADRIDYPALGADASYAAQVICECATPGFANTQEGYAQYRAALPHGLVISEVLSKNAGAYSVSGELPDAIELVNLSDEAVALDGYFLSDTKDDVALYRLPAITLEPGGVFVVAADGAASSNGAPFKVSAEGEALYLTRADGAFADALLVPSLESNVSYGRVGDAYAYFQPPTLGAPNEAGRTQPLAAPQSALAPGMYDAAQELTLSGEGEIYYTVNGAEQTKTRGTL